MKLIKLFVTAVTLLGIGFSNSYAQKKTKPVVKALAGNVMAPKVNRTRLLANVDQRVLLAEVEKFVLKEGRWPRAYASTEEAYLAAKANRALFKRKKDATTKELVSLRQFVEQTEAEAQTLADLEKFIAQYQRLPQTVIKSISGTPKKVDNMSLVEVTEFRLACQIKYIQAEDPNCAIAQKIQALQEKWSHKK